MEPSAKKERGRYKGFWSKIEHPLVSILVRTCGRPNWLKEALLSVKRQTYPNIEILVVEDGLPLAERMVIEQFAPIMNIQYHATGVRVGRSRTGNIALTMSTGEWLNFLDDDDLFMRDHIEVLLRNAILQNAEGAYGISRETTIQVISEDPLVYKEMSREIRYRQPFCRITLWHYNYMPIQSVLFNRRLYQKWGGLEEGMEQLEDWNLWTRYTLENDLVFVDKCTSIYRVTADGHAQRIRQKKLDQTYQKALEKQRGMQFLCNPRWISESIEAYLRSQTVFILTRGQIRSYVERFAITQWLLSWRGQFRKIWSCLRKRLGS